MNLIRQSSHRLLKAAFSTSSKPLTLEALKTRSLIRVKGDEVVSFLQGLITNDMNHLTTGSNGMYTMFLNKAGRVLYDSMVYRSKESNTYLVECDSKIVNDLKKHLQIFRVRRKITIDTIDDEFSVWVAGKSDITLDNDVKLDIVIYNDPRLKDLGTRIIAPNTCDIPKLLNLKDSSSESLYKELRYRYGVGEGVTELPPGKCFPLESNCDFMHGVSFHKGCYLGQEFTARTHHTGVIRKRLMPIEFTEELSEQQNVEKVQSDNGKSVGVVRGVDKKWGIGLLKVDDVLNGSALTIGSVTVKTSRPTWWPQEAPILPNK